MMKINHLFYGPVLLLSGALIIGRASAQPATAPVVKPIPPLTLAELEKLIGGRTTLTLNLKDATLEEAAAAISASSGLKIQVRPKPVFTRPPSAPEIKLPPEPRYTFEAKGEPFWEAFLGWQRAAHVIRQAELAKPDPVLPDGLGSNLPLSDLSLFGIEKTENGLWLQSGNPISQGRPIVSWPDILVANRLTRTQQGNLDEDGLRPLYKPPVVPAGTTPKRQPTDAERWTDDLLLHVQAYLDPRIKPAGLRCEVEEAIDDEGNDLRVVGRAASFNNGFSSDERVTGTLIALNLRSKPKMGEKLVRLRGTLRFSVVTRNQHWETTDLTQPTAGNLFRNGGEFGVQFQGLTGDNGNWTAKFSAQSEGDHLRTLLNQWNQWGLGLTNYYPPLLFSDPDFRIQLVDDAGNSFESGGSGSTGWINTKPGVTPPASMNAGDSPAPADIENWRYKEDASISFRAPSNR